MKKKKISGSHSIGNRTVIGIICIVVALATCFGLAPFISKLSDGKTEIVRMVKDVPAGQTIKDEDVEVVEVGNHNLPDSVIKDKSAVVGKFAVAPLVSGDYVLPGKISNSMDNSTSILDALDSDHKAISISISSFALGFSGKLETGDIVSIIVYDEKNDESFTPLELNYVKVITTTTSSGVDKENIEDESQPTTITLLVNTEQAELLAYYEKTGEMHVALEYRGGGEMAQKYLDAQDLVFGGE